MKLFLPVLFSLVLCVSCGNDETAVTVPNVPLTNIKVSSAGHDSDQANDYCKEFLLTNEQAKVFFNKSRVIDAKTMHDKYDYLPCYVKGTAMLNSSQCEWEIRAGGTADVNCEDGQDYIMACGRCDELLRD